MAKYLLSTDLLLQYLQEAGASTSLSSRKLKDLAVSALSLEWIVADSERMQITPNDRRKWRTNVTRFREILLRSGGEVLALSEQAIEQWGKVELLTLTHRETQDSEPHSMSTEERLVVATAAAGGYIYLTHMRDWNATIEVELGITVETP